MINLLQNLIHSSQGSTSGSAAKSTGKADEGAVPFQLPTDEKAPATSDGESNTELLSNDEQAPQGEASLEGGEENPEPLVFKDTEERAEEPTDEEMPHEIVVLPQMISLMIKHPTAQKEGAVAPVTLENKATAEGGNVDAELLGGKVTEEMVKGKGEAALNPVTEGVPALDSKAAKGRGVILDKQHRTATPGEGRVQSGLMPVEAEAAAPIKQAKVSGEVKADATTVKGEGVEQRMVDAKGPAASTEVKVESKDKALAELKPEETLKATKTVSKQEVAQTEQSIEPKNNLSKGHKEPVVKTQSDDKASTGRVTVDKTLDAEPTLKEARTAEPKVKLEPVEKPLVQEQGVKEGSLKGTERRAGEPSELNVKQTSDLKNQSIGDKSEGVKSEGGKPVKAASAETQVEPVEKQSKEFTAKKSSEPVEVSQKKPEPTHLKSKVETHASENQKVEQNVNAKTKGEPVPVEGKNHVAGSVGAQKAQMTTESLKEQTVETTKPVATTAQEAKTNPELRDGKGEEQQRSPKQSLVAEGDHKGKPQSKEDIALRNPDAVKNRPQGNAESTAPLETKGQPVVAKDEQSDTLKNDKKEFSMPKEKGLEHREERSLKAARNEQQVEESKDNRVAKREQAQRTSEAKNAEQFVAEKISQERAAILTGDLSSQQRPVKPLNAPFIPKKNILSVGKQVDTKEEKKVGTADAKLNDTMDKVKTEYVAQLTKPTSGTNEPRESGAESGKNLLGTNSHRQGSQMSNEGGQSRGQTSDQNQQHNQTNYTPKGVQGAGVASQISQLQQAFSEPSVYTSLQSEVIPALLQQIERFRRSGKNNLRMKFDLPEGKSLVLQLRLDSDRVKVRFQAESPDILDSLNEGWESLVKGANKRGIELGLPEFAQSAPMITPDTDAYEKGRSIKELA